MRKRREGGRTHAGVGVSGGSADRLSGVVHAVVCPGSRERSGGRRARDAESNVEGELEATRFPPSRKVKIITGS